MKIHESLFFTDLSAVQAARQITRINSGFCITSFICTVLFHCQNIMFLPNNNNLREKQLKKLCNAFQKLDSLFSLSVSISQSWCQPANVTEWAIRNIKSVPRCRDAYRHRCTGQTELVKRAYRPLVRSAPLFTTWPPLWPVSDAALACSPAGFSGRQHLVTSTTQSLGDGGGSSIL